MYYKRFYNVQLFNAVIKLAKTNLRLKKVYKVKLDHIGVKSLDSNHNPDLNQAAYLAKMFIFQLNSGKYLSAFPVL